MGTRLGWGARPAHPKAGYDLQADMPHPCDSETSAVQRTGHTEAIHTAPRLHPALQTRELAGQVTERVAPGASEGAGPGV